MWLFLAGDAMSFGGLLAGYGALRLTAGSQWPNPQQSLGINLTAFMTFLLIVSSVTMVKSLSALRRGDLGKTKMFLGLTVLGGILFLSMQAYEWTHLIEHGMKLSTHHFPPASGAGVASTLFATTFFITTGFHGCHVFGGVVYMSVLLVRAATKPFTAADGDTLEIAGLYWHFVDLIWILVFTFIYLL
jgi:heme/copper-type cytochrome/quinol oxidase subunit 3